MRVPVVTAEREDSDQIDDEAKDRDWQQTFVLNVRRLEYSLETKDIHETKCKIIREENEGFDKSSLPKK